MFQFLKMGHFKLSESSEFRFHVNLALPGTNQLIKRHVIQNTTVQSQETHICNAVIK
jgi:hypothetical protein